MLFMPDMQWLRPLLLGCAALVASCDGLDNLGALPLGLSGVVYHDEDGNGVRNDREKGLARVIVSNGRDVVLTDVRGRWLLPNDGPRDPFVIPPRGWRAADGVDARTAVRLQRWTASPTPTVAVGDITTGPPADAQFGKVSAETPVHIDDTPPSVTNVGDLVVLHLGPTLTEDERAFVTAVLEHSGSGRPVLALHASSTERAALPRLAGLGVWHVNVSQAPFKATLAEPKSVHFHFVDASAATP